MWIKICANTCLHDALRAAELGADAVGFVFAPSKRRVTPRQVAPISAELPPHVDRVGVFGDDSAENIAEAAQQAGLTAIQLHAGFDPLLTDRLVTLLDPAVCIIQTVHWEIAADANDTARNTASGLATIAGYAPARRVLVDAKAAGVTGGMGISFDWKSASSVFASQPSLHIILAGGLHAANVAEAIRTLHPWGVDVASGVEREPGRKDFVKLKAFMDNARGAA
jgi:phosphoribosylanthranilate isomerase